MKKLLQFFLLFILDIFSLIKQQNKCDILDMLQIVAFGLLINALYGLLDSVNLKDSYIVFITTYGIMRARKDIKDKEC